MENCAIREAMFIMIRRRALIFIVPPLMLPQNRRTFLTITREDLIKFYMETYQYYCGIDLHARNLYGKIWCIKDLILIP
jgi:hypothetical protein